MTYITGFCGIGHCEGKSPTSPSGKPMKVCVAHDICGCPCHARFTKMHKMAGEPRHEYQNPRYVPAIYPDLSEFLRPSAELDGTPLGDVVRASRMVEQPSESSAGLLESTRDWTPTPGGTRQRGQLEAEVQKICNRKMMGEFDEPMTPQVIAELIDPEHPPSTGAIGAVFNRWEALGYAKIHRKPLYFSSFTIEGMKYGLDGMRERKKMRR